MAVTLWISSLLDTFTQLVPPFVVLNTPLLTPPAIIVLLVVSETSITRALVLPPKFDGPLSA